MIFVTDPAGKAIYLSTEWTTLTGQTLAEAVDYGWTRVVHEADRDFVRGIVGEAIRQEQSFSMRYRVRCSDGGTVWLLGGAVPSFGPPGRTFLGFLGAIAQVAEPATARAQGGVGTFAPLSDPAEPSRSSLEAAADHLIMAHALLGKGSGRHILSALRPVLYQVGLALAQGGTDAEEGGRVH